MPIPGYVRHDRVLHHTHIAIHATILYLVVYVHYYLQTLGLIGILEPLEGVSVEEAETMVSVAEEDGQLSEDW